MLQAGQAICHGLKSRVNASRPLHICIACERRLTAIAHTWPKVLNPPPAAYRNGKWECDRRIVDDVEVIE